MYNKTINILVTGVGAIIGYGVINNLRQSKFKCNIIGIDIFSDAVGQKWCDKFIQGIRADSKDYITFLNKIIVHEKIDLVIPAIEQDLEAMINNFSLLEKSAKYSLNNKNLFNVFHDKKKTYDFLFNTIDLIPNLYYCKNFYENAKTKLGLPFVLKQDISYASKGVALIHNIKDFEYYSYKFGEKCMAQKYLEIIKNEYTCSIFGTGDGSFVNPICLERELSAEGATSKAINIEINDELLQVLTLLSKKCLFEGPTNIQFIKFNSKYLLLEINARISSSTSIRTLFGINEAEMCIEYYLSNKIPEVRKQKYSKVVRYIKDLYIDSNNI
jgi:carbamoyl-phosphate synthase large subunit